MTTENTQEDAKKIWDELDAQDRGEQIPTPETPEGQTPETATTAPAAVENGGDGKPAQADPTDPAALIAKIDSLQTTIAQLTGRVRNTEGRLGSLNGEIRQQIETARQVREQGAEAPSATEISAAQASPEAFAALEKEYPEFAKAMKPVLDAAVAAQMAELKKTLPQPAQNTDGLLSKAELETFKRELKVEAKHEGWTQTVKGDAFKGWLSTAPYEVQMLAHSDAPEHAIRLLDLFEESKKPAPKQPETKPSQAISSAAALPTGGRSAARTKNVDDMTPQEYWAYLDQQDKLKA